MEYRQLGRSGVRVSPLCLGSMNFGPQTSQADSFRIMDRALEHGLNFWDTANVYGQKLGEGITEQIIGRYFAQGGNRRERVVLATKVYNRMGEWPNESRLSALHIRHACDESLRRLQTDHLDLYQMHHIARECPWEEVWQAFELLVQQGKVIYVGSSNFAGWHLAQAQELARSRHFQGLVSEQSLYNLAARTVELEVVPACAAYGLGLIPWSPLGGGFLGGALQAEGAGRRTSEGMRTRVEKNRAQLGAYEALCAELGEQPADVALAWLLHNPVVTAPIIGPRTLEQLDGSLRALEIRLSPETLTQLDAIFPGPGGTAPEAVRLVIGASNNNTARGTVAIIGGGVSGTLVAAHLLAKEGSPRKVVLIEPRGELGRGLAYSTRCPGHLLNVPAGMLSVLPDEPDHFLNWAQQHSGADAGRYHFFPRSLFGSYVCSFLKECLAGEAGAHRFQHLAVEVQGISLSPDGVHLHLNEGPSVQADFVVLALGNPPPREIVAADGATPAGAPGYYRSPWSEGALAQPGDDEDVLLIGTGLTAVDAAIALRGTGYGGTVHAFSRHGRLPRAHRSAATPPVNVLPDPAPQSIRELFSLFRRLVIAAAESGLDWRSLIDGLRPNTNGVWEGLPTEERTRFQRHLRSLWDIHRHRMAPAVAESITTMEREGSLRVHAGRLAAVTPTRAGFQATLAARVGGGLMPLEVGRIINATGPESDYRRISSPLIADLLAQGLVAPGPLGQGLGVASDGALYQANGERGERLFTLGPPRVGTLVETVAVPEIRIQALELAGELSRRCRVARPSRG